ANELRELLRHEKDDVRSLAADELAQLTMTKESLAALETCLHDSSQLVQLHAAGALLKLQGPSPQLMAVLEKGFQAHEHDVRHLAKTISCNAGKAAVPALLRVIETGSEDSRALATGALGDIGTAAQDA